MITTVLENVFAETDLRGCNPGFVVTTEGVVVIDTPQLPTAAVRMRKEAESHGPIKYLINTEHHVDHIFGNYFFSGAGTVIAHAYVRKEFMTVSPEINPYEYAREAIPTDDPDGAALFPDQETYFANMNQPTVTIEGDMTLHMGDTTFQLICTPGHTLGQVSVYIPEKKVLFTADNVFNGVQTWHYASDINQWIKSLIKLKALDFDVLVPGHGPICDRGALDAQISILYEWQYYVSDCIAKGMSPEDCISNNEIRDRFPVDIGQEYMLDHVMENNIRTLYKKMA